MTSRPSAPPSRRLRNSITIKVSFFSPSHFDNCMMSIIDSKFCELFHKNSSSRTLIRGLSQIPEILDQALGTRFRTTT
jgi:hypothetical protein